MTGEPDQDQNPRLRPEDLRAVLDRQTQVLRMIARTAPLAETLGAILTSLEALIPGARCSVLLLDRADDTLRHGAAPSLPGEYIGAIDGLAVAEGSGACGTAAARNESVVCADVRRDPRWQDFRALALDSGLVSCWSTPIHGGDGSPVGTFAVYHSRPHRPGLREQLLVERFRELAAVAIEHSELLAEQRAAERDRRARLAAETARRTAEELLSAKSQLLAAVGHDARTPMQAIVGFAEVLQTLELDDEQRREALRRIGSAAEHVMELLADVLDLSRIEANALTLTVAPTSLREAVDEVLLLLASEAASRGVSLSGPGTAGYVLADARRLRQILLNLVGNAIRHGRSGGQVRVGFEGGPVVTITVQDDGPGLPTELIPRLFTPYAVGPGEGSVGLGLALAHGLAGAMGGDLRVGRSSANGTTMLLRLPAADPAAAPTSRRTQPERILR